MSRMSAGKVRRNVAAALAAAAMVLGSVFPAMAEESAMDVICAPAGIVEMPDGAFLVTDTYNKVVWKVENRVSTVYAGGQTVLDPYGEPLGGYNDAALPDSYFKSPWGIVPFLDGYAVSDPDNNVVRLIRTDRTQTATGTRAGGYSNGIGTKATLSHPTGLAVDGEGNLYIADTNNNVIRRVTTKGSVTTYASGLSEPTGICWRDGALYVAETGANRIVKVANGDISVIAGKGSAGRTDGAADQAEFSSPQGITVSDDGIIYVSDTGNNAVRRIQDGTVNTLIACNQAEMQYYPIAPMGLLVHGDQLYICDNFSRKVFVIPR